MAYSNPNKKNYSSKKMHQEKIKVNKLGKSPPRAHAHILEQPVSSSLSPFSCLHTQS